MRCGTCGSMVTASEKAKLIKETGKSKTYYYYHCTKKKSGVTCDEKPITLYELEAQIEEVLQTHTILPEFRDWAIDILNRDNDKEIETRTKIYESQHKNLSSTQKQLDTLTQMRYRDLINDEEYLKEKESLLVTISNLQDQLRQTESRAGTWIELTEKTFNFACGAKAAFENGTIKSKREILSALGQNFILKGKRLNLEANKWLVPIKDSYTAIEDEFKRLELENTGSDTKQKDAFASLCPTWGPYRDLNPGWRFHKPQC
jgi:hypothetical protein